MERGADGEDIYYLCNIGENWYVVFETDYISSLSSTAKEIIEIFTTDSIQPTHWLAKKAATEPPSVVSPFDEIVDSKPCRDVFITKPKDSYLRYAILAFETPGLGGSNYHPHNYGSTN